MSQKEIKKFMQILNENAKPLNESSSELKDLLWNLFGYGESYNSTGNQKYQTIAEKTVELIVQKYGNDETVSECNDDLEEVAPPNADIEKWIKSNKGRFEKEYGKEKGDDVLYGKAWNMEKGKK